MASNTPLRLSTASSVTIPVGELERQASGWILDGEMRQLSKQTLYARRFLVEKFLWFLRERRYESCGTLEIRAFLAYLNSGLGQTGGRWGNSQSKKEVRPRTVQTYFGNLRTLFRFLVAEGVLDASPMEHLRPPIARADQVQPFTEEQLESLLAAAKKSRYPRRDEAIVYLLLDTGCRASELCGLRVKDVDFTAHRCTVLGKGNKTRVIPMGRKTTRALWAYHQSRPFEAGDPFFVSRGGTTQGTALTRSGLLQLIERLGEAAGLDACRCSPHTFRHTFAVSFLRNGGNLYSLQEILGHTSLMMVRRYVALAQADIEAQHRQFSPADRLSAKRQP